MKRDNEVPMVPEEDSGHQTLKREYREERKVELEEN